MPVQDLTTPTNENSVDVSLLATDPDHPENLTLYSGTTPIDEIDFPEDKRFIRFTFPDGYSDFAIRVFETNENEVKQSVMSTYEDDAGDGIAAFDSTWNGKASSTQQGREFKVRDSQQEDHTLVVRDQDKDGTDSGTLHSYIIRFTYNSEKYLLDPSIRNKQMG